MNVADKNLLVEVVEKTSEDEVVRTNYYFVDAAAREYSTLSLDSFMNGNYESAIRISGPTGIRFRADILNSAKREETEYSIEEYGFIISREDVLGVKELTFDSDNYVSGAAFDKSEARDVIFDSSNDEFSVFAGVLINIPEKHYETKLVCKTYTKICVEGEDFVVYGEEVTASYYEIAKVLLETELDEETYEYLLSVVEKVESDIRVDIGDLYN